MKPMVGDRVQASTPTFVPPGGAWPATGWTLSSTNASNATRRFAITNPLFRQNFRWHEMDAATGGIGAILSLRAGGDGNGSGRPGSPGLLPECVRDVGERLVAGGLVAGRVRLACTRHARLDGRDRLGWHLAESPLGGRDRLRCRLTMRRGRGALAGGWAGPG